MKNKTKQLLSLIKAAKLSCAIEWHKKAYGSSPFYAQCWAERVVKDSSIIIDSGYWSFSPFWRYYSRQIYSWNPRKYKYKYI